MNKKYLALFYLLLLTCGTILSLYTPKVESVDAQAAVTIPNEAIRLRILANSDEQNDQAVKRLIRDEVNKDITVWVQDLTSIEEARKVITSHLPEIQATAEEVVKREGLSQSVTVEFGKANFPTKLYGQYLYPAGVYEAVVITLGAGEGANWWCVLFPPLCFLDFSNGTAVSQTPFVEDTDTSVQTPVEPEEAPIEAAEETTQSAEEELENEPETVEDSDADKLAAANVYTGEEEPPVVVKSFFAELFTDLF
ncbi:stage II sporulation protein R [Peribacillus psychrosaccharolyticus]|uniref:Stage II sporulation protein R n=1 Tax=Peribacillus psychrosaccharolyticus TaxID=1407 RepID=A0A974RZ68_PERPY|nr:stage II sporulation protein R [Peribacillus psychrosaccharolyticus]MEC2055362.1 stage II sporulation protein R [Peribacillus psychrosaccharolyticus]MED3745352.1 stage II sporulation protein R [Peribacillus psychrosaccharolyticus]QQS99052.1 stage II sporulation protein R [Peribacillus psychrosaccharolyticus]